MTSSNFDGPDDAPPDPPARSATFRHPHCPDGNWFHEGGLIGRPALVKLFATVLRRSRMESIGLSHLQNVAPSPLMTCLYCGRHAVRRRGKQQQIRFHTNVDDTFLLGPDHPLQMRAHHTELAVDEDGL